MTHDDTRPELPPSAQERSLTPAPEDYAKRPALVSLVWPVLWLGAGVALAAVLAAKGFTPPH